MTTYAPIDIARHLGEGGGFDVIVAALLGVPLFVNGYDALPFVGSLIDAGMNPSVGLAFLLGSGVSSAPAALAVWALARPSVFLAYLALGAVGVASAGLVYAAWLA